MMLVSPSWSSRIALAQGGGVGHGRNVLSEPVHRSASAAVARIGRPARDESDEDIRK